jgi:hypothetical protein
VRWVGRFGGASHCWLSCSLRSPRGMPARYPCSTPPAGIEAFLSHLTSYAISVDVETIPKAWTKPLDLVVLHGLSAYDAAYLELALRRDLPLPTKDRALIDAARRAGVRLALEAS